MQVDRDYLHVERYVAKVHTDLDLGTRNLTI